MNLPTTTIDELIYLRQLAREQKDWAKSDEIRDSLDTKLVFVFDTKQGQEVYFLNQAYFQRKPEDMSERTYIEYLKQRDMKANAYFDNWLHGATNKLKRGMFVPNIP